MAAFNVVRFRVRPGSEQQFIEAHQMVEPEFEGFLGGHLVKTGDRTFCMIGEWQRFPEHRRRAPADDFVPGQMRHLLEDLGGGMGVTDPVSGEVAVRLWPPQGGEEERDPPASGAPRSVSLASARPASADASR